MSNFLLEDFNLVKFKCFRFLYLPIVCSCKEDPTTRVLVYARILTRKKRHTKDGKADLRQVDRK